MTCTYTILHKFVSSQLNPTQSEWDELKPLYNGIAPITLAYLSVSNTLTLAPCHSLSLSLSLLLLFGCIASVYVAKTFPYKTQRQTLSLPSVTYVSSMNFTWFQFVGWFSAYFLSITSKIVRFRPYFVSFWNLNLRRCCVSDFILIHLILYPNHNVYSTATAQRTTASNWFNLHPNTGRTMYRFRTAEAKQYTDTRTHAHTLTFRDLDPMALTFFSSHTLFNTKLANLKRCFVVVCLFFFFFSFFCWFKQLLNNSRFHFVTFGCWQHCCMWIDCAERWSVINELSTTCIHDIVSIV